MTVLRSGLPTPIRARRGVGRAASLTAWALAFLVLRLFVVSGYDWETAFGVSTTIGIEDGVNLLFGSFLAGHVVVSLLLLVLLPLLIAIYLWSPTPRRAPLELPIALGLVTMAAITLSFRTWWLPVGAAVLLGVFGLVQRLRQSHPLRRAVEVVAARIGWVGGAGVLLVALLIGTPWVPQERITTTNGVVIGYVLSVDSGYLNVLTEDQDFVIILTRDVRSRD